ncbi:membrane protein insertase YidC [Basilea psittacipulmonis]|uniref:Membrane protein insertase YidC n=1 Tax=Basilea psittacipulmonis DSM 24701 TaxID=1072685 RepID=A0A077DCN0_9BURK|nr:membrane protein insertase YidC [Basilea psittacipulmonis]AIL31941.1 insertase [Basilea psittacipulmonis DSM 24701]
MNFRQLMLWLIVAFCTITIWNNWHQYTNPTPVQTSSQGNETPNLPISTTKEAAIDSQTTLAQATGELIDVSTDLYRLKFDTLGAQLVYAELLAHQHAVDNTQQTLLLDNDPNNFFVAQTGLSGATPDVYPNQKTLFTYLKTEKQDNRTLVSFEAQKGGLQVVRTYTIENNSYDILVNDKITNISDHDITASQYYQITRNSADPVGTQKFDHSFHGLALYTESGKFQKLKFSDIADNDAEYTKETKAGWISYVQHYFVTAWVPDQTITHHLSARKVGDDRYALSTISALPTLAPNASITTQANLWVGPQDKAGLAAVNPTLDVVVDYGWVTILAKPMFSFMAWIHSIVGNWGWTIIILTIVIKLILFPLSAASYKSMAKMKRVAPRMNAIREQYGDDRQKLNAAMFQLYKDEKINPMGGCLPILLQIPVFFTLYRVIQSSVELRGAPWLGWIHDLSVTDPYYILPVLMVLSMFLQFALNPTPADPMQAKMMKIMPLIFGAFMFFFPAGLVLYWLVNNILSIAQQAYISKKYNAEANEAILKHK